MATKFQVGDKVTVTKADGNRLEYGFNENMQETLDKGGQIEYVDSDGSLGIKGTDGYLYWYGASELALVKTVKDPSRKPVAASLARKIGNTYAIVKNGEVIEYEYNREAARDTKAYFGGAKAGVSIVMMEPTTVIR
tara:strand:- start:2098 stop:2505 length:408 start_codon:yes stop_codon:yes gene_type:complete